MWFSYPFDLVEQTQNIYIQSYLLLLVLNYHQNIPSLNIYSLHFLLFSFFFYLLVIISQPNTNGWYCGEFQHFHRYNLGILYVWWQWTLYPISGFKIIIIIICLGWVSSSNNTICLILSCIPNKDKLMAYTTFFLTHTIIKIHITHIVWCGSDRQFSKCFTYSIHFIIYIQTNKHSTFIHNIIIIINL